MTELLAQFAEIHNKFAFAGIDGVLLVKVLSQLFYCRRNSKSA